MAPVLFLFIMQAAYKTLQKKLTCEPFEFRYFPATQRIHKNKTGALSLKIHPAMAKPSL